MAHAHTPTFPNNASRSGARPFASPLMVQMWDPYPYRHHGQQWFENIPTYTLPRNSIFLYIEHL